MSASTAGPLEVPQWKRFVSLENRYIAPIFITLILLAGHLSFGILESYQKTLSLDPNNVDALISLGDLYKSEGLASRAQSCYEDVLKINKENPEAKSRLADLVGKKR